MIFFTILLRHLKIHVLKYFLVYDYTVKLGVLNSLTAISFESSLLDNSCNLDLETKSLHKIKPVKSTLTIKKHQETIYSSFCAFVSF